MAVLSLVLLGLMNGASIGDALKTGLVTGVVAGTMAGLANSAAGAKVNGQREGSATADNSNIALRQRLDKAVPNANLQGVSAQELAHNTQKAWGAKSLTLAKLKDKFIFHPGKSPFTIVEKSLISGGEFTVASYGTTTIFANNSAPVELIGESISSSGFSLGNEVGTPVGLFSKTKGTIYFDQTMKGNSVNEIFSNTSVIHSKSAGSLIKFSTIKGFDASGNLLWHATTKGTCLCSGIGGTRYPFNLK